MKARQRRRISRRKSAARHGARRDGMACLTSVRRQHDGRRHRLLRRHFNLRLAGASLRRRTSRRSIRLDASRLRHHAWRRRHHGHRVRAPPPRITRTTAKHFTSSSLCKRGVINIGVAASSRLRGAHIVADVSRLTFAAASRDTHTVSGASSGGVYHEGNGTARAARGAHVAHSTHQHHQ